MENEPEFPKASGPGRGPSVSPSPPPEAWAWLHAGLAVELGLADAAAARAVQASVRERAFRPAEAHALLAKAGLPPADDPRIQQRAGRLMVDLVMAPTVRGMRGAARKGRGCVRQVGAFAVVQGLGFVLFAVVILGLLIVLRAGGHGIDAFLDGLLERWPWPEMWRR